MGLRFVLALLVLGASGAAAHASQEAIDPPRIVDWRIIGNAGLGMSRERIEYLYGHSNRRFSEYRVLGGKLFIAYSHGYVDGISTDAPRYRTRDDVGVGTKIPLGPCHTTSKRRCERRWRGFVLENGGRTWIRNVAYGRRTIQVFLWVERGSVVEVDVHFWDKFSPGWGAR